MACNSVARLIAHMMASLDRQLPFSLQWTIEAFSRSEFAYCSASGWEIRVDWLWVVIKALPVNCASLGFLNTHSLNLVTKNVLAVARLSLGSVAHLRGWVVLAEVVRLQRPLLNISCGTLKIIIVLWLVLFGVFLLLKLLLCASKASFWADAVLGHPNRHRILFLLLPLLLLKQMLLLKLLLGTSSFLEFVRRRMRLLLLVPRTLRLTGRVSPVQCRLKYVRIFFSWWRNGSQLVYIWRSKSAQIWISLLCMVVVLLVSLWRVHPLLLLLFFAGALPWLARVRRVDLPRLIVATLTAVPRCVRLSGTASDYFAAHFSLISTTAGRVGVSVPSGIITHDWGSIGTQLTRVFGRVKLRLLLQHEVHIQRLRVLAVASMFIKEFFGGSFFARRWLSSF